jgi:hypothetical protein
MGGGSYDGGHRQQDSHEKRGARFNLDAAATAHSLKAVLPERNAPV